MRPLARTTDLPMSAADSPPFLGLDAGGTATRWALCTPDGAPIREGQGPGISGLMVLSAEGRAQLSAALHQMAADCGPVQGLCAGLTGFDGDGAGPMAEAFGQAFALAPSRALLYNDIELACRAAFAPGEGHLVYAGTGSVAAHIDPAGELHRAGGRGGLIDDGGSGYWIAVRALRSVWRAEDEQPGAWRRSVLAQQVFEHIGGSDWGVTRNWVNASARGQIGELAVAVAAAAGQDNAAQQILRDAGRELARLGQALVRRCGALPLRLAGRVFQLHPLVEDSLREALAGQVVQSPSELHAHRVAARLAAAARSAG